MSVNEQEKTCPEHGDVRAWRQETRILSSARGVTTTGTPVALGAWVDETVSERYCAHCKTWVEVRGVTGMLRWMGTHEDGDCPT